MTKLKPIHVLLSMTIEQFQEDYTERYMRWCMSHSLNLGTDLQKIMANRLISNYYNIHFSKLQMIFIEAVNPIHGKSHTKIIRNLYSSITAEMFEMFPSVLIEEARKLSIVNQN